MDGTLTVIWWRDIPAQVTAREDRRSHKMVLHQRFQVAIDRAAKVADKQAFDDYIAEWRKVNRPCGTDLEAEVNTEVARLEAVFTTEVLAALVKTGGVSVEPQA
jgi:hypothetical protein